MSFYVLRCPAESAAQAAAASTVPSSGSSAMSAPWCSRRERPPKFPPRGVDATGTTIGGRVGRSLDALLTQAGKHVAGLIVADRLIAAYLACTARGERASFLPDGPSTA